MPDNVDNLVLEHLRHIRGRVDQIGDDLKSLKPKLSSLERSVSLMRRAAPDGGKTDNR